MPDERTKQEYREAYDAWVAHVAGVHRVLLEGERVDPPRLKGLLNREARAKARYDAARKRLLGIEFEPDADELELEDDA